MKLFVSILLACASLVASAQTTPVHALLDRVDPGASSRFHLEIRPDSIDFFEIYAVDGLPAIAANNPVNLAVGLNWYLKHYTGVHLSWNNLSTPLPALLPLPADVERHTTDAIHRYYLNYCTHSYSMPFWDRDRWQREIDWMALHGINMPLAITGVDAAWRNTLLRLGYSEADADAFIAGPAFQAWWLMNNLEGWGGPNSGQWYADRIELRRFILDEMKSWGMSPVLPGYSGMLPHDAETRLGLSVSGKGLWNGFTRPVFMLPDNSRFEEIAAIYYDELTRLYGPADYYSMDPFHEGGSLDGVDLKEAAATIARCMKRVNPDAVWVVQGWNENPRQDLLDGVAPGDLLVLDLASEIKPGWGDPQSPSKTPRPDGFGPHDWLFCMLLNFGGNVGLHGRMDYLIDEYYKARSDSRFGPTLRGYGLTMEGIDNNPVMYELMSELIWRDEKPDKADWLLSYARARYGAGNDPAGADSAAFAAVDSAWAALSRSIYNCPPGNMQQGTTESVFCARPSLSVWQVSSWSRMEPYYAPDSVIQAALRFAEAAPALADNPNYRYDLVDIVRQGVAERGRLVYKEMVDAFNRADRPAFIDAADRFLSLILAQDRLLASRPDFGVGNWIESARALAHNPDEADLMERNARLLITTWGPREASEAGKLRDYAHREWSGLLRDFYYPRWQAWIDARLAELDGADPAPIDFYSMDDKWVNSRHHYPLSSGADEVAVALDVAGKFLR